MKSQRQKRAELYAQLASIESLSTLEEWKKLKLIEDAKQAGYELLDLAARFQWEQEHQDEAVLPTDQEFLVEAYRHPEKAWHSLQSHYPVPRMAMLEGTYGELARKAKKGGQLPTYWEALRRVHPQARRLIGDFLTDGWLVVRQKDLGFNECWMLEMGKNREVTQYHSGPDVEDEILFDLIQTIKCSPCPFRKCPICQSIFAPVRRQKYCSPNCTARAFSSTENPDRKKYMSEYMAKKRKKAKSLNRKGPKKQTAKAA